MVNCKCNDKIQNATEIKYLGIMINNTLNWSSHIDYLASKLRKFVYMFYKLRDILPLYMLKTVYKALVESVISYGIIIWGGTYNIHVHPLLLTQKYILKVMLSKRRMYPTDLLFAESKVFDIRLLYVYNVAKYMYRRPSLRQYVCHTHNTRHISRNTLKIPKALKTSFQKFISSTGPKIYNLLPVNIRNINNFALYCKILKKYTGCPTVTTH